MNIAAPTGNAGRRPGPSSCARAGRAACRRREGGVDVERSSRAWAPTSRCSLRSSIHFTDRPSSTAAATTATSSGFTSILTPNAPPTSCAVTRGSVAGSRARSPSDHPDEVGEPRRLAQERHAASAVGAAADRLHQRRRRRSPVSRGRCRRRSSRRRRRPPPARARAGAAPCAGDLDQRPPDRLPPGEQAERPLHHVRVLRGRVVRAACPPPRRPRPRTPCLHRLVRVPVLHEPLATRRGRRAGTRRRRRRTRRVALEQHVAAGAGPDRGRDGVERVLDRGDRRELLVVDPHQLGRVLGDVSRLADDQRDRVADDADAVDRERVVQRVVEVGERQRCPMKGLVSASMSAPVKTATTPGRRRAASTSIAADERGGAGCARTCACSMSGTVDVVDVATRAR